MTQEFDYIVVGAGSAGCVLANRLTASGRHTVQVLEAGPRDINPWISIPLGYGKLFNNASVNWLYQTEPEPHLNDRRINQPRGKVLGGSSSINGLIFVRGQSADFDAWRDLGNPGWSYADLLPYFIRSENHVLGPGKYHGADGPMSVSGQTEPHRLCEAFIAASRRCGYPRNDDFNGEDQEGVGYYHTSSRRGIRCSTSTAYLKPARNRSTLNVETHALVKKILFQGNRAIGVEWQRNGRVNRSLARLEVLICAGAINSPQLLELSGVGSEAILREHGIPVIHHLIGVGEHLQDHLQVRCTFRCTQKITLNDDMASLRGRIGMGLRYLLHRRGPMTVSAGYAGAFLRTDPALSRPDVQALLITFSTNKMGAKLHSHSGFTASVSQLRPHSRGSVHIKSAEPQHAPAICPNYFTDEIDRRVTVAGLQAVRRIAHQTPLADYVAEEIDPGCGLQSYEELLGFCRNSASSLYHPTCSARMGSDARAVVDSRLRVHGLQSLRVVDGSIMPSVVSGNTNAAIIAIAEKASDMVLEDAW